MLESPIQDTRRWWSREDLLLLVLLGILLYLPGLSRISLFDRDEARFATAAREMITTGDFIVPHFNGNLRPDKPPLCYWLMSAGYYLTGGPTELGARLPSATCSTLTLIVLYFAVGKRFGRVTGLVSSLILGTTALFVVESRLATADATMLLFITLCMAGAWQAWDSAAPPPVRPARWIRLALRILLFTWILLSLGFILFMGFFLLHGLHVALWIALANWIQLSMLVMLAMGILREIASGKSLHMPLWMALAFWIALALGTLAKGVPLFFVLFPMLILSLATGTLPQELKAWKSHFHLTSTRITFALVIAGLALLVFALAQSVPTLADLRLWTVILAILLLGMVLAPRLPATLLRCAAGGNWAWWRQLRPLVGIPLLLLLVGWWVVLAGLATDWKLIQDMVGIHFLNRALGPLLKILHLPIADLGAPGGNDTMKSYGKPPGFYLLLVWATFWPWSILLVPAAYHALRRLLGRTALAIDPRPYQFLIAWIVPTWIILELARGKLPHYPLPIYIPLAILCADTLVQSWHRMTDVLATRWFAAARWGTALVWVVMGSLALAAASRTLDPDLFWRCVPLAGALFALAAASAIAWSRPSWPFVVVLGFGAVLLIADTVILPEIPALRISKTLGESNPLTTNISDIRKAQPQYHVAFCGYDEPSVVFYAGTHVDGGTPDQFITKVGFAPTLPPPSASQPATEPAAPITPYLAVINQDVRQILDDRHLTYYILRHLRGLNTGNFKPIEVYLIANTPPQDYAHPATTTSATESATRPE